MNSAEVIDLFDVNDHIPNVPTQQPIIRRPTPTTRLNVPLNNQNTEFSAVFPGRIIFSGYNLRCLEGKLRWGEKVKHLSPIFFLSFKKKK